MTSTESQPVLILGAGVHGAAIARALLWNGVSVHVVDAFDVAFGATSKSSRLIHGGLRYLEYGDFRLVRESLQARSQMLADAPQFSARPLRLQIPTSTRWSGWMRSAIGFFGLSRTRWGRRFVSAKTGRGYWPVRIGLAVYDRLFPQGLLPISSSARVGAPGMPRVRPDRYRWLCSYSDAQMLFPERLVLALLAEAREIAAEKGLSFQVSTYSQAECEQDQWIIRDRLFGGEAFAIDPTCVVNATGAWGDETLQELRIEAPPQFAGTKGTHFLTWNEELRHALQGQAVYAEADDGRLVFVLPFGEGVLVGTTDETFAARPETAVGTEEELDYLMRLVNGVMDCRLIRDDIVLHYSGVRPLPKATSGDNGAVSRDHALAEHRLGNRPVFTLIGGKLTTWREFAEQVADRVLRRGPSSPPADTSIRPILGSSNFPETNTQRQALWEQWSLEFAAPVNHIAALWPLYGTRAAQVLRDCRGEMGTQIHGTDFTTGVVRWVIEHEWVRTLADLIERRLMLVFSRRLSRRTLVDLSGCLVSAGGISAQDVPGAVAAAEERLATYYGRHILDDSP